MAQALSNLTAVRTGSASLCLTNAICEIGFVLEWDTGVCVHTVLELLTTAITALQVLVEELPLLLASINFKRSMRWRGSTAYSRPLRWLMALHGSTALPFTYAGMTATDVTRLLRNSQHPICQVSPTALSSLCFGPLNCLF